MQISPISFGKTVKIMAPFHEAVRIANAANGAPTVKPEIQEKAKEIFNDTDKGHALAFKFNDMDEYCYIFSGKESREYLHNLYQKALFVRNVKLHCSLDEAIRKIVSKKQEFNNQTADLIARTQENYTLTIGENGSSIDIIE